jgi:hypothetical protein
MIRTFLPKLVVAGLLLAGLVPSLAFAQTDLQATIRAALAEDPRTQAMTQEQRDSMVAALTSEAQQQGMVSQDVTWRPVSDSVPAAASDAARCGTMPAFFCLINTSFGLSGPDYVIPFLLGLLSLILIFIIAMLLERHHLHVKAMRAAAEQQAVTPVAPVTPAVPAAPQGFEAN